MAERALLASSRVILMLAMMLVAGCIPVEALPGAPTPASSTSVPTLFEIQNTSPQPTQTEQRTARWTPDAGIQAAIQETHAVRTTQLAATDLAGEALATRQAIRRAQREQEATGTSFAPASTPTPEATATATPPLSKLSTPEDGSEEDPEPAETAELASAWQACTSEEGGRQKIRVENKTGDSLHLYLSGSENYACAVEPGVQRIYVKSGTYQVSSVMCDGKRFNFGSHVINPTWYINLKCP